MTSHITEADIDRLLDRDADDSSRFQVRAHLDACAECSSRWEHVLSTHGMLANRQIHVPPTVAPRAIAAARLQPVRRARGAASLKFAAVLLLGVALGAVVDRLRTRPSVSVAPPSAHVGYLFVFSGARDTSLSRQERMAIGQSFVTWTDSLRQAGQLVAFGQLTSDAPRLVSATEPNLDSLTVRAFASMEGFYVLRARNDEDALALARSCPYLRFGGTIVVRRPVGASRPPASVSLRSEPTPVMLLSGRRASAR